jgi:hypothetical protein
MLRHTPEPPSVEAYGSESQRSRVSHLERRLSSYRPAGPSEGEAVVMRISLTALRPQVHNADLARPWCHEKNTTSQRSES